MSLLIKGMEMVFGGQTIEIAENVDGRKYARIQPSFDEWHEVIEVPTPHGRLIDANISEDDRQVYGFVHDYDLQQLLDSRPTVIEAEK